MRPNAPATKCSLFWQEGRAYLRIGVGPLLRRSTSHEIVCNSRPYIVGLVSPALAAAQHYAVEDTVGNCSVIDARPSANLKILGNKGGYDSVAAAQKALGSGSSCKGMIDRA